LSLHRRAIQICTGVAEARNPDKVIAVPEIAQDMAKQREILGIAQNLEAALRALERDTDDEGRPITPALIGDGLNQMLAFMTQHATWFMLQVNAGDDVRRQIDGLEDAIKAASAALAEGTTPKRDVVQDQVKAVGESVGNTDDSDKTQKKWWQFWK
jgi:hypothetical protein